MRHDGVARLVVESLVDREHANILHDGLRQLAFGSFLGAGNRHREDDVDAVARNDEARKAGTGSDRHGDGAHAWRQDRGQEAVLAALHEMHVGDGIAGGDAGAHHRAQQRIGIGNALQHIAGTDIVVGPADPGEILRLEEVAGGQTFRRDQHDLHRLGRLGGDDGCDILLAHIVHPGAHQQRGDERQAHRGTEQHHPAWRNRSEHRVLGPLKSLRRVSRCLNHDRCGTPVRIASHWCRFWPTLVNSR